MKKLYKFINKKRIQKSQKDVMISGNHSKILLCEFSNHNKIGDYNYLYQSKFGDYTYTSQRVTILHTSIGKFCSIGQDVSIGLGKHPVNNFVSTHPAFYSVSKQCGVTFADKQYFNETGQVVIGNDVWIGSNSIILDDIKIANGVVIAANSVVNKDIPPYAIVGGSPARIIRYRFTKEDIQFLEDAKWWDKDPAWLEENFRMMHDINLLKSNFYNSLNRNQ